MTLSSPSRRGALALSPSLGHSLFLCFLFHTHSQIYPSLLESLAAHFSFLNTHFLSEDVAPSSITRYFSLLSSVSHTLSLSTPLSFSHSLRTSLLYLSSLTHASSLSATHLLSTSLFQSLSSLSHTLVSHHLLLSLLS